MSTNSRERTAPTAQQDAESELAAAFAAWRGSLESVQKRVEDATAAIDLLRTTLREMAPLWRSLGQLEKALTEIDLTEALDAAAAQTEEALARVGGTEAGAGAIADETAAAGIEEALAEAAEETARDAGTRGQAPARLEIPSSDGGARYSYTLTVEEVGARVKLVPLHQSLAGVEGVRELSLKSYTNGVAVVSVDSDVELETPVIEEALTEGMQRACRVIPGEGPTFLARMSNEAVAGERQGR